VPNFGPKQAEGKLGRAVGANEKEKEMNFSIKKADQQIRKNRGL